MHALIVLMGFLFAIRGARGMSFQRPVTSFWRIWREAADLLLTWGLLTGIFLMAVGFDPLRSFARQYVLLFLGFGAYLLARHQHKTDFFFLSVTILSFLGLRTSGDYIFNLSWAWAVSFGAALFQTCILGLRYKLLFSRVPGLMKGWPLICLLGAFISLAFWGVGRYLF